MIRVCGLTKSYGGVSALSAVTFHLEAGGRLAVCGPSGCGKTTLLRLVAGLEAPDGGTLHLNGILASGNGILRPPNRRGISVCFQRPALWPHLTVEEHLHFPLSESTRDAARARVAELLAAFGLTALARRRPEGLSGGEARRVALARALSPRAPILILDEPFAHLDALWRERACEQVRKELEASGAILLLAVHAPQDAGVLCPEHMDLSSSEEMASP